MLLLPAIPMRHAPITPNDGNGIGPTLAIRFQQAGTVRLADAHGNTADYVVNAGEEVVGEFSKWLLTGTVTTANAIARYAA